MTSVKAFADIYCQFLDDLLGVYPDNEKAKAARAAPITRTTMDRFMKYAGSRSGHISTKSKAFFDPKNKFMVENGVFDVVKSNPSETTLNAIWNYVSNMYMLGMTMSMLPPEMLAMVENTADKFAKEAVADGEMNEEKLMASMQKMMASMMSGGKMPGLQ